MFTDLHDVAQVMTEHIREAVGVLDVQPGPPRDAASTADAGARITLLYLTPQPAHANDAPQPQANGTVRAAPLALSCYYLLTTSGSDLDDPVAAHHVLGRILSLYHDAATLQLPLSQAAGAPAGVFSDLGDGSLHVAQVPMSLDQIDKIWTPVEVQLQPWALFEVWPVQLVSATPDTAAAPPVRPGGIGLDVRVMARPVITRITPDAVRPGGRVRIDAILPGGLDAARVDSVVVGAGDPSLVQESDGKVAVLTLDDGGLEELAEGSHRLTLRSAGLISAASDLQISGPSAPAVDALAATGHDLADPLVLTGSNLVNAQEAVFWPDRGVAAPSDVRSFPLEAHSAGQATVAQSSLAALVGMPGAGGLWRCALRVTGPGADVFTPYVVLELIS